MVPHAGPGSGNILLNLGKMSCRNGSDMVYLNRRVRVLSSSTLLPVLTRASRAARAFCLCDGVRVKPAAAPARHTHRGLKGGGEYANPEIPRAASAAANILG